MAVITATLIGWCSFVIGREKDPSTSEVARLIQQSLEQDRRRAEAVKARELLQQMQMQSANDEDEEERESEAEEQRQTMPVCHVLYVHFDAHCCQYISAF